jgi:hypothetical protein
MKKLILSVFLISSVFLMTGCGFGGGCETPCGTGGSSLVMGTQTSCCSSLPW